MSLRKVKSLGNPKIFSCDRPFSNFKYRENNFDVSLFSLARVFSQARMAESKTCVQEEIPSLYFSKDDDLELKKAKCGFLKSKLIRISFFNTRFDKPEELSLQSNKNFVGYAILKKYFFKNKKSNKWIVFESIISHTRHDNNFIHTERQYLVRICNKYFIVCGNLYCQQNEITNMCAHVALRSVLSALSTKGDVSTTEINGILKREGMPHKIGVGLDVFQIEKVLRKKRLKVISRDYKKDKQYKVPYTKLLYGGIESGYPVLLGFFKNNNKNDGHIIPILGHTFNQDSWLPGADSMYFDIGGDVRFIPSESWVSAYIGHDDNFGSNLCIPRNYLANKDLAIFQIMPNDCNCDSIDAEAITMHYLNLLIPEMRKYQKSYWSKKLIYAINNRWLVLRPTLVMGDEYVDHLEKLEGWDSKKIHPDILNPLKRFLKNQRFWLVEISYPELFPANKIKLGEVLLRSDIQPDVNPNFDSFVMARMVDKFYFLFSSGKSKTPYFWPANTGIGDHVQLFCKQVKKTVV